MSNTTTPTTVPELLSKNRCLPRITQVDGGSVLISIACSPRNAANQAKCITISYNQTIATNTDCAAITANNWANTITQLDTTTTDCQATCKFSPKNSSNNNSTTVPNPSTKVLSPSTSPSSSTDTIYPNFMVTFIALFFVFIMFYKRA